jgi:hypothetical protein
MDVDGFLWISEGPSHTGRPWDATDEGDLGRLPVVVMDDEVGDPSMILLKAIRAIGDAVTCSIALGEIPCGLVHLVGVSSGGGITGGGKVGEAVSKVGLDLGVSLNLGLIGGRQVGDLRR